MGPDAQFRKIGALRFAPVRLLLLVLLSTAGCRSEPPLPRVDDSPSVPAPVPPTGGGGDADRPPWLSTLHLGVSMSVTAGDGGVAPESSVKICVGPFLVRGPCDSPNPHPRPVVPDDVRAVIGELIDCYLSSLPSNVPRPGLGSIDFVPVAEGGLRTVCHVGSADLDPCRGTCVSVAARKLSSMRLRNRQLHVSWAPR